MKKIQKILFTVIALFLGVTFQVFTLSSPVKAAQAPWIMTLGAPAYSTDGFGNRAIPNTSISVTGGLGGNATTPENYPAFLSDSLALAGNGNFTSNGRNSRYGNFSQYDNKFTPEFFKTFAAKYKIFLTSRGGGAFTYQAVSRQTIAGSVADQLAVNKRNFYAFEVNGDLTIANGTKCDLKGVFFISGTLNIGQTFENEGSFDGCVFFADTINFNTTAASATDSSGYSYAEGFFFAQNSVNISASPTNRSLRINGSVIGDSININRTGTAYDTRPTFLVTYDPRYKFFFRDLNSDISYSLREVFN